MPADVLITVAEAFELTFATSPSDPGRTVTLTALYGLDGVDTGTDGDGEALSFPVSMDEGLDGVYLTEIALHNTGPVWARVSIDGVHAGTVLIRVVSSDFPAGVDAISEDSHTIAIVAASEPASIQLTVQDSGGSSAGLDGNGAAITWPQAMVRVGAYQDSWYYDPITFSEGGRYGAAFAPVTGPIWNDVIVVHQQPQSGALGHYNGWEPDAGYIPQDWVTLSYVRRWTGWTTSHVGDEDLREFRRMAIETFIHETNMWVPAWLGTWYGLRGQGPRLYLPVPILLPQDGGSDPVVKYVDKFDQDELYTFNNDDLAFRVRGHHAKQPYLEYSGNWDPGRDVVITATWGTVGANKTIPLRFQQALVGLIRWHSLSFGVDSDDARDQSTLNRISREGTRDLSVQYHDSAIGMGITGDRTIDRILAEMTIRPGPWIQRCGDRS